MSRRVALRVLWLALALTTLIMLVTDDGGYSSWLIAFVAWCGGIVTAQVWPDVYHPARRWALAAWTRLRKR